MQQRRIPRNIHASVSAPILLHHPVDGLHSLEKAAHRATLFRLTQKIEGVKTESFFDNFPKFFRLVRRPGVKRGHLLHRKMTEGGPVRLYSKALVEKNRKYGKGRIESRGVELVYPVGGEPGARAQIARCSPQGCFMQVGEGLKQATGREE
jgi:hypothetical protein